MKKRLRKYHVIFTLLILAFSCRSQILFYQDIYKGGVCADGANYSGYDYQQADTIVFSNIVPSGSTIKKAYLLSSRTIWVAGKNPSKDVFHELYFNNTLIEVDSSDVVTPKFNFDYSTTSGKMWVIAKDVTPLVQNNNNTLITPCQACLMLLDTARLYVLVDYVLVIMYENSMMPDINSVIVLNDKTFYSSLIYNLNGLNPINTSNSVGFSIWSGYSSSCNYSLNSSLGNFNLGILDMYVANNLNRNKLFGSFKYDNTSLVGLEDDTPDFFIDSTDALTDIKPYISNNSTNFSIQTSGTVNPLGVNERLGFFLAYTTPCPASTSKDTSIAICRGQNVQLNSSPGFTTYNWYPLAGLTDSTIANPIATPQHSTNYITYIKDASGCMHTEHTQIIVHGSPAPDSIHVTNAICGTSGGSLLIDPNYHNYQPYTYNIGSGAVTDTSFSNLTPGSYTLTVNDNIGCSYSTILTINEINPVHASFSSLSSTNHTAPLLIAFDNSSTGANNYNWYFPTDTLHNVDPVYTFNDSGTYVVTLIAYNNLLQCSDTATAVFVILPADTSGIFIPNVFSPNADGINDVWQVQLKNAGIDNLEIFDRWGLPVFQKDKQSFSKEQVVIWDGRTTAGMTYSEGTYFYVISYTALNKLNQKEERKAQGFVTLVR